MTRDEYKVRIFDKVLDYEKYSIDNNIGHGVGFHGIPCAEGLANSVATLNASDKLHALTKAECLEVGKKLYRYLYSWTTPLRLEAEKEGY